MTIGIYTLTNKTNSKVYVGQSWNVEARLTQHRLNKTNTYISNAINKCGWCAFDVAVFPADINVNQEQLDLLECSYIQTYESLLPHGYNVRDGGSNGKHSLETKQKMSATWKRPTRNGQIYEKIVATRRANGKPWISEEQKQKLSLAHKGQVAWNKGKTHTDEAKQKMSDSHKNISDETRKKLSDSHKGKTSLFKGREHSEQSKQKNSEAHKGRIPWNKGKKMDAQTKEHKQKISISRKKKGWKINKITGKREYYLFDKFEAIN